MTTRFAVRITVGDRGQVTATAVGEIDIATVDQFAAGCQDAVATDGLTHLTIDLSGVEFLGSVGIATLIRTRNALNESAGFDVIASRTVAHVLSITGTAEHLHVTES